MSDAIAYHIGIGKKDINGAKLALIPGDPERVARVGEEVAVRDVVRVQHLRTHQGKARNTSGIPKTS